MALYRTVVTIEILTDGPFDGDVMPVECIDGYASGMELSRDQEVVAPDKMCELLEDQGTDPGFFTYLID